MQAVVELCTVYDSSLFKRKFHVFSLDNENSFVLSRVRTLQSTDIPDYAVLNPMGTSLIVACKRPIRFVYDSVKPITEPVNAKKAADVTDKDGK